ncbi:MAG: hypothetical protein ACQETK_10570 [Pseudomonadota bacterium]
MLYKTNRSTPRNGMRRRLVMLTTAGWLLTLALLGGCGGGSSSASDDNDPSESEPAATGIFLNAPVANLGYRTDTLEGFTSPNGEFRYRPGETVTFFIGDLEFPSVTAAPMLTPLDLADTTDLLEPMVINIIRLLQTLDADPDSPDTIRISDLAHASAAPVDLAQPVDVFEALTVIINLIANAHQDPPVDGLVPVDEALARFSESLLEHGLFPLGDLEDTH